MLGEIRDGETAQMAIRAALTGHLVLSTIHTNSAWGTISRLVDMGIPPFLLSGTINLTAAQRLVRLLCPCCKQEDDFQDNMYPQGFIKEEKIRKHFIAKGCEKCYYTGYKGRKALYEVILVDQHIATEIRNGSSDKFNKTYNQKHISLSDAAFELFKAGDTSMDEVYSFLMNEL
jgi:general secretion pathway protein E/type IV pilus assembly protein PilB